MMDTDKENDDIVIEEVTGKDTNSQEVTKEEIKETVTPSVAATTEDPVPEVKVLTLDEYAELKKDKLHEGLLASFKAEAKNNKDPKTFIEWEVAFSEQAGREYK